jgi:hypothetical protein
MPTHSKEVHFFFIFNFYISLISKLTSDSKRQAAALAARAIRLDMLRFSKVQKKLSKSEVSKWCGSAKEFTAGGGSSGGGPHGGAPRTSRPARTASDTINSALMWCKSAHKLFDMDNSKLDLIAGLQEKLESCAAAGRSCTDRHECSQIVEALRHLGYEDSVFDQEAVESEAHETLKDYEQEACREVRRALRISYEERVLKK